MAKCEDCIGFNSCEAWCVAVEKVLKTDGVREELKKDNAEFCPSFKNKDNFVEVVRCKDCKYGEEQVPVYGVIDYKCLKTKVSCLSATDFCSYGEKKGV